MCRSLLQAPPSAPAELPRLLGRERSLRAPKELAAARGALVKQAPDADSRLILDFRRACRSAELEQCTSAASWQLALPELVFEDVGEALTGAELQALLQNYVREHLDGRELTATTFAGPGADAVHQLCFTMPLPSDAPAALQKLGSMPRESRATLLACVEANTCRVLTLEIQTHDVPFGQAFWIRERYVFRRMGDGTLCRKVAEVRWVQTLPWYASFVRGICESRVGAEVATSGAALMALLRASSGRSRVGSDPEQWISV